MAKILVIEDNELNLDMLTRRLRRAGFVIVSAGNGIAGLAAARSELPDLILMDMSLPEMDGWTATQLLKQDAALRAIPVIALTAHAMASDRARALAAGCDEFETKPIDFPRLLAKLQALLMRSSHG